MYSKIRNFKLGNTISGVLLMMLHAASMAALYIAAKNLMHDIPPKQVTFVYKFSILIAAIPWCMKGGFINNLRTTRLGVHITRGTFSVQSATDTYITGSIMEYRRSSPCEESDKGTGR